MIKLPVNVIVEKIKQKTQFSEEDIKAKIKKKLDQLSGLISEEGAAHIVANELGVKLFEEVGQLQIKNIMPGMRNVEVYGKVTRIYDVREFETEKKKGKVGSFVIGDETGIIRIVAWNEKCEILSNLKPDQIVKVEQGYVRENNRGRIEVHLGDRSKVIINPTDVKEIKTSSSRKQIKDLTENEENVEVLGTIVQVFDPKFFEICPECGKRARLKEDEFYCEQHNKVTPSYSYVMNLFLDDGTDTMRVVLWRNQAQKLLNKTNEEIISAKDDSFEDTKNELLGKIVKFIGRTAKNEMFNRIEFMPQTVILNPDPGEEIERLDEEVKKAVEKPASEQPHVPKKEDSTKIIEKETDNEPESAGQEDSSEEYIGDSGSDEQNKEVKDSGLDDEILSLDDLESLE